MIEWFRKLFNDVFTGKDNKTYEMGAYSWVACMILVVAHDAYQLHQGVHVDVLNFAGALAAVSAAHGIAIGAKKGTDPGVGG